MEKETDSRLAILTGEALKLMLEAGASAEVLGHFAVRYPALAAAQLAPLPPPQEIDLEAVIRTTVQTVLGHGLVGPAPSDTPAPATSARRGTRDVPRIKLNVVVEGKRTTVKLRTALHEKLKALAPNQKLEPLVQSFVDTTPAGHPNRSAWVEEQATQYLVLSELRVEATPGH